MSIELCNFHNRLHVRSSFRIFKHRHKILRTTPLSIIRNPHAVCALMNVSRYEAGQILHCLFRSFYEHIHQSLLVLRLNCKDVDERNNFIVFRDCNHQVFFQYWHFRRSRYHTSGLKFLPDVHSSEPPRIQLRYVLVLRLKAALFTVGCMASLGCPVKSTESALVFFVID